MKKSLAMILTVSMVASTMLSGCGTSSGKTPAGESAAANTEANAKETSKEAVTLTVAARGGTHAEVIEAVKGAFEKENNCKIEVLGLEAADLKQKVALDASNKEGAYDLAMVDDPVMPEFMEGGVLLNLTKEGYKDDSDFVEASLALGKNPYKTGDTYALPFTGNVQLLFFNNDVLKSINKEAPTTWTDVLDVCTAAKKAGKLGFIIRGQQGNPIVSDYLPILWAYGGDVFDENWNVTVDSKEARAALHMYMDLLATGDNYEKDDLITAVSSGNATMALGWPSWFINKTEVTAGYTQIPNKVDANTSVMPTGEIGNWMMGVTANTKNKELSMKLLTYLTSAEVQKEAIEHGGVPTRTSIFTDKDILTKYPFFETIYEGTQNSKVRPRTTKWSNVEDAFGTELSNAVSGVKSVDDAIKDSKTAIEGAMQ